MYEQTKALSAFGSTVGYDEMPMPEDQKLPPELVDALTHLPLEMELPADDLLTPWATKDNDFGWSSLDVAPLDSIKTYKMSSGQVRQAYDKLFGQPVPFLGIVSDVQLTEAEAKEALEGSDYELYEVIAVYSQNDSSAVPQIRYFYWISLGPQGGKRTKVPGQVAAALKGDIVFAVRVPYADSAKRAFPSMSFEQAMDTDLTEITQEDVEVFDNPETTVAPAQPSAAAMPVVPMIFVGAGLAAITVWIGGKVAK